MLRAHPMSRQLCHCLASLQSGGCARAQEDDAPAKVQGAEYDREGSDQRWHSEAPYRRPTPIEAPESPAEEQLDGHRDEGETQEKRAECPWDICEVRAVAKVGDRC